MVEIWLPYGSSEIPVRIPEERLVSILRPQNAEVVQDIPSQIRKSIESNPNLLQTAKKAERTCIALGSSANSKVVSEITSTLIDALKNAGVSPSSLTMIRTPGSPRIDPQLASDLEIIDHDPSPRFSGPTHDVKVDFVPTLNLEFSACTFKILIGELRPHHFLGYSGLSDIVFPGLASAASIESHLLNRKNFGVADLFKERVRIAASVPNLFALGFVLDADLALARLTLGSFDDTMADLQKCVQSFCVQEVGRPADVVVLSAGGAPLDDSLLHAVESCPAALPALKRDGVMILAAECPSGHGNKEFYTWSAQHKEPRYLEARLKHSFTYHGFKAAFLSRVLQNHRIYLVSTIPDHYVQDVFGMRAAATVNAALQTAQHSIGSDSTITVIPDAGRVIPIQPPPSTGKYPQK